eukprot:jgi/Chlat1/4167/Chrsp27S04273
MRATGGVDQRDWWAPFSAGVHSLKVMDKYEVLSTLGQGASGCVLVVRRRTDGEKFAVKQVAELTESERRAARGEVTLLAKCEHPNVTRYYECFVSDGVLCIVMEYASEGDLFDRIQQAKAQGRHFPEEQIMFWFVQICLALKHVHSKAVLHRDLKTQNIFCAKNDIIKLGDFGIARTLAQTSDFAQTTVGTPFYLSPEICEDRPYDRKSDIWALGCVLYEMTTLRHAFDGQSLPALVLKILRGRYPPIPAHYSSNLRTLIASMLKRQPEDRPSVNQVLALPYVRSFIQAYTNHIRNHFLRQTLPPTNSTPPPAAKPPPATPPKTPGLETMRKEARMVVKQQKADSNKNWLQERQKELMSLQKRSDRLKRASVDNAEPNTVATEEKPSTTSDSLSSSISSSSTSADYLREEEQDDWDRRMFGALVAQEGESNASSVGKQQQHSVQVRSSKQPPKPQASPGMNKQQAQKRPMKVVKSVDDKQRANAGNRMREKQIEKQKRMQEESIAESQRIQRASEWKSERAARVSERHRAAEELRERMARHREGLRNAQPRISKADIQPAFLLGPQASEGDVSLGLCYTPDSSTDNSEVTQRNRSDVGTSEPTSSGRQRKRVVRRSSADLKVEIFCPYAIWTEEASDRSSLYSSPSSAVQQQDRAIHVALAATEAVAGNKGERELLQVLDQMQEVLASDERDLRQDDLAEVSAMQIAQMSRLALTEDTPASDGASQQNRFSSTQQHPFQPDSSGHTTPSRPPTAGPPNASRIEALRQHCEQQLGEEVFVAVYRYLQEVQQRDDNIDERTQSTLERILGPGRLSTAQCVHRLILYEEMVYSMST